MAVGRTVQVYWDGDGQFYDGTVLSQCSGLATVQYDDGELHEEPLWALCPPGGDQVTCCSCGAKYNRTFVRACAVNTQLSKRACAVNGIPAFTCGPDGACVWNRYSFVYVCVIRCRF